MKRVLPVAVVACCLLALCLRAWSRTPEDGVDLLEYELVVDGKVVDVPVDRDVALTTAGGETLNVRLRRKQDCVFSGHGLTFTYPGGVEYATYQDELMYGLSMVGGEEFSLNVDIYLADTTLEVVREYNAEYMKALREGYQFEEFAQELQRDFDGRVYTGLSYIYSEPGVGDGVVEEYVVDIGGRVVSLSLEYPGTRGEDAHTLFSRVFKTLRPLEAPAQESE